MECDPFAQVEPPDCGASIAGPPQGQVRSRLVVWVSTYQPTVEKVDSRGKAIWIKRVEVFCTAVLQGMGYTKSSSGRYVNRETGHQQENYELQQQKRVPCENKKLSVTC